MRTFKFAAAALMIALSASCTSNGTKGTTAGTDSTAVSMVNPDNFKPRRTEIDSVSYLLGVNFGAFVKGYDFGEDLNYKQIERGLRDFLKAKGDYTDSTYAQQFKINPEELNNVFNSYLSKRREYVSAVAKNEEVKFLAENKKKEGVQVTESGLQYIIREAGNDVKPGPADTVYVHYKGTLTDGTVFDESPKNDEGIKMTLNRVIKGWTEGLQLIGEGGKMTLYVPSKLGYGENGTRGIKPNSTLIFDIELVKVSKVAENEEAK